MFPIRVKTVQESDLRMLGSLARNIQRVLPVTQADIDAAAALGKGWVVWKVFEVSDPLDNMRGGTQLIIRQNSVQPGQNVRRVIFVSGPGGQTVVIRGTDYIVLPDAIANSLSYVKAFGGTEQRNLPDGYIQRQYIYMMAGSYLLTDIVPTYDMRVEMDFQTTTVPSGSVYLLGGRAETYGGLFFARGGGGTVLVDAFGTSSDDRYTSSVSLSNNTRYKFTFNNKVATLESGGTTLFTTTFTGENANDAALAINALNPSASGTAVTGGQAGIYLYSFKAWNAQGELVMDLVPAVQKGTVPVVGFYDTVSKTFKTATAGTFAAGGEAVPTPDTPIDIVSNNGVLKVSPNLFNNPSYVSGSLDDNGVLSTAAPGLVLTYYAVKPNTTYTFSFIKTRDSYYDRICGYQTATEGSFTELLAKVDYRGIPLNTRVVITFTTDSTTNYIRGFFPSSLYYADQPYLTEPQLEPGSTATPYMPYRQIYTDGTTETVEVFGSNLIDLNAVTDGYYYNPQGAYTALSTSRLTDYIPVEAGEDVRVYSKSLSSTSNLNVRINIFDSNKVWQSQEVLRLAPNAGGTMIITPTANGYIRVSGNYSGTAIVDWNTASITESSGSATAEMLLKVGDYQDVQSIIDGVVTRNVGIKVLDGTENWQNISGYMNINKIDLGTDSTVLPNNSTDIICTHYETIGGVPNRTSVNVGRSYVNFRDDNISTLTDWKQWLANQYAAGTPVIIVFPLATPTTESVAGQTLQVTDGDNVLEITQASLNGLELEAQYNAAVSLTIQEVQDANLDNNVTVTIQ